MPNDALLCCVLAAVGPEGAAPEDEPLDDASLEIVVEAAAPEAAARSSSEAVTVIDLTDARREAADLGEVLARTEGVTVQRAGGLGAAQRVALDGFGDDQVRVFLDGVPLAVTGLGASLADVPTDLLARVDVYHGVVPIRFGADALGGAFDLVTPPPRDGVHGRLSWQAGSWDTHRLAGGIGGFNPARGLLVQGDAFFDTSRNDWPIDVEVADLSGGLTPTRLPRRHAAYRAGGGVVRLGVRDQAWADRFDLTASASATTKEEPHNQVMTVPYGGVAWTRDAAGATARWTRWVHPAVQLGALAAYGWRRTRLVDQATTVVDWFGQEVRDRPVAGELDGRPHDRLTWQHSLYGRVSATWLAHRRHRVELTVTPDLAWRSGDEREQLPSDVRDPWEARQRQLKVVSGVGWTGWFAGDRLELTAFAKAYGYHADTAGLTAAYRYEEQRTSTVRGGAGAGLSARLTHHLWLRASYEAATRLPGPDEVFGDGVLTSPNVELAPETSHNVNLELQLVGLRGATGGLDASLRGVARVADDLIVLLSRDVSLQWQNVYAATGVGAQGAIAWTSPGDWVALSGSASWLDLRNRSDEGGFATFAGDRIPNRPWLNAAGRATFQAVDVAPGVQLHLRWTTRYVHAFYRTWASAGLQETKQQIPSQLTHGVGAVVAVALPSGGAVTAGLELSNLTDAPTFDVFGVQRPGRAVAGRLTATW